MRVFTARISCGFFALISTVGLATANDKAIDVPEMCRQEQDRIHDPSESPCSVLYDAEGNAYDDPALLEAIEKIRSKKRIVRMPPKYPTRASTKGSGLVACSIIQFDIGELGRPENVVPIKTITKDPNPEAFELASVRAVKRWRYPRFEYDGQRYSCKNVKTYMSFYL